MDGLTLLGEARAAGLKVAAEGDKLVIRGPRRAEPMVRKLIDHKPEVMAVLASVRPSAAVPAGAADSTEAADWRGFYAERAAFRQYEAGYGREVAEHLAFGEVVEAWCRHYPQPHDPAACAGCGRPLAGDVLDLPDASRVHWQRRGEFACLIAAGLRRKERAVAALAGMGLTPPDGWETT